MKTDIHPVQHPVVFKDEGAGAQFFAYSSQTSDEKETIDGVEYYVIRLDVSSASHPFYTGKQNLVDTSGRVERFNRMMQQAQEAA